MWPFKKCASVVLAESIAASMAKCPTDWELDDDYYAGEAYFIHKHLDMAVRLPRWNSPAELRVGLDPCHLSKAAGRVLTDGVYHLLSVSLIESDHSHISLLPSIPQERPGK